MWKVPSCSVILTAYSTSMQIAQVHRATLSDGQEVVVKVQHDGVNKIILEVLIVRLLLVFILYFCVKMLCCRNDSTWILYGH